MVQELRETKISFTCMSSTKDLQMLLDKEMHGIQRLPDLLLQNPEKNLEELDLSDYEVQNNEPLHDVSHDIQHLYKELPHHAPKDFKKSLKEIIQNSFNGKEAKNSSNYRDSLVVVCFWLIKHYPNHFVTEILTILVEIQEILYVTEEQRNQVSIFSITKCLFQACNATEVTYPEST